MSQPDPDKSDPRIIEALKRFMPAHEVDRIFNPVERQVPPQESPTVDCPLKVVSLKFYDSFWSGEPLAIPAPEDRQYNTSFPIRTDCIMYELNLGNHKHDKYGHHTILATYYNPNGEILSSKPAFVTIDTDSEIWSFSDGYGDLFRKWDPGIYRVVITIARYKQFVAEGTFTVV